MDKQERALHLQKLIKFFRKQGKSASESRRLAGEAMRVMAQGQQWQDKAQRKADKLENYIMVCALAGVTTLCRQFLDILFLPRQILARCAHKFDGLRRQSAQDA